MKKIVLFLLVSTFVFAQENSTKNLLELKSDALGIQKANNTMLYSQSSIEQNLLVNKKIVTGVEHQLDNIKQTSSRKNPGLAILYSLLLPGMGELYAGSYETGKYFTIADGVLWGVFAGFDSYGVWKRNNYRSYAQTNAGVNLDGKDADYFANISVYISVDEFNRIQDLNRDYNKTYKNVNDYWKWSNDDQRKEYRQMWSSSESAFNNVRFVAGALVLNRLISAINAVRLVAAYNKNLTVETSWNMSVGVNNQPTLPTSITFNFVKTF